MAETKEEGAKRRWLEVQEELSPGETEVSRTLDNIATVRAGWHRVRNEAGEWAYFPNVPNYPSGSQEQLKLEREWEQRSLEMHAAQVPIRIEPKPQVNELARRVVRGD